MSKLIELLHDAYPYGCKGDVIKLADDALAELDKLGKRVKISPLYKEFVDTAKKLANAVEAEVVEVKAKTTDAADSKKAK